jgi:regulator of sirC expression with transglutaminase-like and TPR domain
VKQDKLNAILTLLEDPDDEVFGLVSRNLFDEGVEIVPDLEKAWETTLDERLQQRLENLIGDIQFNGLLKDFKDWLEDGYEDLIYGAYLVSKFQFPDLAFTSILEAIEKIRADVWLEINNNLTALEKVRIINHVFYDIHDFGANTSNFYSPQNSYLNQVLETKKGNSVSLAIIYSNIATSLGIPIHGVNLPKNFILAYKDDYAFSEEEVMFYINPFNKGAVLGKKEIDYFLKQQKIDPKESFYKPCSNKKIVQRLILNLVHAYQNMGYKEKIKGLQQVNGLFIQQQDEF